MDASQLWKYTRMVELFDIDLIIKNFYDTSGENVKLRDVLVYLCPRNEIVFCFSAYSEYWYFHNIILTGSGIYNINNNCNYLSNCELLAQVFMARNLKSVVLTELYTLINTRESCMILNCMHRDPGIMQMPRWRSDVTVLICCDSTDSDPALY